MPVWSAGVMHPSHNQAIPYKQAMSTAIWEDDSGQWKLYLENDDAILCQKDRIIHVWPHFSNWVKSISVIYGITMTEVYERLLDPDESVFEKEVNGLVAPIIRKQVSSAK